MPTINADVDQVRRFTSNLRKANPEVAKALKVKVSAVGKLIRDNAREEASWSEKIPPTIRSSASGNTATVRAGSKKVPIAKWFEQGKSRWKHPVFPSGPRSTWRWAPMTRPSRPFLRPALMKSTPEAKDILVGGIVEAIESVLTA